MLDFTRIKYTLTAFRTKKTYLVFLVGQLALALIIVPVALSNPAHFKTPFVIFLEVLLFLLFAFDLLVVRWVSEGSLCGRKSNIFDLGLLLIFAATLVFLIVATETGGKDYRELLQTDDIAILIIVMSRYVMQVIRLVCIFRNAKINRDLHKQIQNIDLNNVERTRSNSLHFHDMHRADQILRKKISHQNELVEES